MKPEKVLKKECPALSTDGVRYQAIKGHGTIAAYQAPERATWDEAASDAVQLGFAYWQDPHVLVLREADGMPLGRIVAVR